MVMLVFREEKSPEDEAKAWQFWHGRQHSAKQRILDAGKKSNQKTHIKGQKWETSFSQATFFFRHLIA